MSQCQNCGAATEPNQLRCNKCGTPIQAAPTPGAVPAQGAPVDLVHPANPPKSATTALILSCLISGVGQIYLGQTIKGIVILIGSLVLWGTIVGGPVIWIVAMVDAHAIGNKLASGKSVGQWEFF